MKYKLLLLLILCSFLSNAQEDSIAITTDRPGFSEYSATIPRGYFQIEAGFSFFSESVNPEDKLQQINWNNTLLRYGLLEGWELRLGQTYQSERLLEGGVNPRFIWQSFSGPVVVGTKINLLQEAGLVPQTAIIAEYGFNTFAPETLLNNSFFRVQISSKYMLNPDWYLMLNLGYDDRFTNFSRLRYTINTGYSITDKFGVYAEIYGFRSRNLTPTDYANAGFTFLINPKFQLDAHAGFDLVERINNSVDYQQSFVAFGLAYLFKVEQ